MTAEKKLDTNKQPDNSQDKFADKRLSDNELEKIAGGTGGEPEIACLDEPLEPQIFVSGK